MRHVRALLALVIACTLLISGFPEGTALRVAAQGEGVTVPVTDEEGAAVGSITVTEVIDPFTEFDPAYPRRKVVATSRLTSLLTPMPAIASTSLLRRSSSRTMPASSGTK